MNQQCNDCHSVNTTESYQVTQRYRTNHHHPPEEKMGWGKSTEWVGMHCTLYPPPHHTIHPPLTDLVLGESVNFISEVPDTRYSVN